MPDPIPQDDDRPKADPSLTRRFEALDDALNGPRRAARPRNLNWSGSNENTATFESIAEALEKSSPPARPTSDEPPTGRKQAGS